MTRDSAGIRIVENAATTGWALDAGWRLSPSPILEIGMAEGSPAYLFDRVVGLRRVDDGGIVVADAGSAELRFFHADGAHHHTAGRRGAGPGEFRNLSWLGPYRGDSLIVYDAGARRASVLSSRGEFSRELTFPTVGDGGSPRPVAAFDDGTLLGRLTVRVGPDEVSTGMTKSDAMFGRFAETDGAFLDTIARLPGEERHLLVEPTMMMITSPLIGPETYTAVHGDSAFVGYSGSFEVGVYAGNGTLRRLIRRLGGPVPVTEDELARLAEARLGEADDDGYRQRLQSVLEQMPPPIARPAYSELAADDEGNLWVRETTMPGEPNLWSVFDREGRMLGAVTLPDRFRPLHIGADHVSGIVTDELDVQRVRVYALDKG